MLVKAYEELTELEKLQNEYSDFYKDVHGFRPRGMSTEQWNSVEWFKAQMESLAIESERVANDEANREREAIGAFEVRVDAIIAAGAGDRAAALRWILDANEATDDPDFLCYKLGLPYGYFK